MTRNAQSNPLCPLRTSVFNIPLYFSAVEQTSSSYAGLHLIPNAVVASACSLGAGLIMARTGTYRRMMLVGGFMAILGPLSMSFWSRKYTPEAVYWVTMLPGGIAYGSILTITLVALIASIDPKVSLAPSAFDLSVRTFCRSSDLRMRMAPSSLPSR